MNDVAGSERSAANLAADSSGTDRHPTNGVRKGERRGGRQVGTPNKATAEVREIAAAWGPAAISKAAELAGLVKNEAGEIVGQAESEQARIAALGIILDRAYGRPPQAISADVRKTLTHEELLDALN